MTYAERGYVVSRKLFPREDPALWRSESDRLLARFELVDPRNLRTGLSWRPGARGVERLDPVIDVSTLFASVARDARLLSPLRAILGDEPRLVKDKLVVKPPGMDGYRLHQDASWWQTFPYERMVSTAVALDRADASNGALEIVPGRHRRLLSTPGELRDMTDEEAKRGGVDRPGDLVELDPGDVVIFSALAPHRSAPNRSREPRRMLYLTYAPASEGGLYDAFRRFYLDLALANVPAAERSRYFFR